MKAFTVNLMIVRQLGWFLMAILDIFDGLNWRNTYWDQHLLKKKIQRIFNVFAHFLELHCNVFLIENVLLF